MMTQYKVAHLTSVHQAFDVRIFLKECRSLAASGYRTCLIAPHEVSGEFEGVQLVAVPLPLNRRERMTLTAWKVYREAVAQDADLYHFHDPELIPVALLLKLAGKKVVYDAHELYAAKILSKPWIAPRLRSFLSKGFSLFEHAASRFFDHVITADRHTAATFRAGNVSVIANYPFLPPAEEFLPPVHGGNIGIYVGEITSDRGLQVMLEVARKLRSRKFELRLLGHFPNVEEEREVQELENVHYLGCQAHNVVLSEIEKATLGFVLLQPVPAYYYAGENTIKLFEYMSRGLPVIASKFPNLERIVRSCNCGVCVDPENAEEAAQAVSVLLDDPELCRELGRNGRNAVLQSYNWETESRKLLQIYHDLLSPLSSAVRASNAATSCE